MTSAWTARAELPLMRTLRRADSSSAMIVGYTLGTQSPSNPVHSGPLRAKERDATGRGQLPVAPQITFPDSDLRQSWRKRLGLLCRPSPYHLAMPPRMESLQQVRPLGQRSRCATPPRVLLQIVPGSASRARVGLPRFRKPWTRAARPTRTLSNAVTRPPAGPRGTRLDLGKK